MNLFKKIKYAACHLCAYTTTPVLTAFISNPVLAAGFQRGNAVMQKVAIGLHGMAAITITVAVVWVGYKTLWNGESLRSCGYIIIGGILIGGGSEIGALLIGSDIGKPY